MANNIDSLGDKLKGQVKKLSLSDIDNKTEKQQDNLLSKQQNNKTEKQQATKTTKQQDNKKRYPHKYMFYLSDENNKKLHKLIYESIGAGNKKSQTDIINEALEKL